MSAALAPGALGPPPARLRPHAAASCSALAVPAPPGRQPWHGGRRLRQAPGARGRSLRVSAAYSPYPWQERDYYRVALQMVQTAGPLGAGMQQGYFLLMRVTGGLGDIVEDADRALVMSVGGDTLTGVAQLAQGLPTGASGGRPLSLDLLWQVLQRGQEISKRTWNVLRVAVVELRGNTFVGRVFFGDTATGQVAWDCDCRPSDACWLALKSQAPIYIHRTVWEDSAMLLRDIQRSAEEQQAAAEDARARRRARAEGALEVGRPVGMEVGQEVGELTPQTIMTTPRPADPEPLKRLKMEMRVALHEEDYAAAARIRDHPWMKLHLVMVQALQAGDLEEADRCQQQLQAAIHQHEEEEQRQQRQHHERGGGRGSSGGGWSEGPSYGQFY